MMRKWIIVVVVLALAVPLFARSCGSRPVANADSAGTTIVAFGDSLTAGTGVEAGEDDFVSLLEAEFGVSIINAGVPGDTTALGRARIAQDVLAHNPKVVLLELGGNDLLQQGSREEVRQNLTAMIQQIQDSGAAVVLLGVDGPLGYGGLGRVYEQLAEEYETAYVPNILRGVLGKSDLMADQVHPNAKGHAVMADRIAKVLRKTLPETFNDGEGSATP